IKARAATQIDDIDIHLLRDCLSRLFPEAQENHTDWQKVASFVSVMKRFCVISGGPGTGKSTVIAKILSLVLEQAKGHAFRIALAAPTGKAAARLQQAVKNGEKMLPLEERTKDTRATEASTIHRLLGSIPGSPYFRHNTKNPLPVDIVVIDEASMVDLALMSKLVQAIPPSARLILLGDKDQLASVEAGAVLGDICDTGRVHGLSKEISKRFQEVTGDRIDIAPEEDDKTGLQDCVVQLKKSYRFETDSGIGAVSRAVNKGDGDLALKLLKSGTYDDIRWKPLPKPNPLHRVLRQNVLEGYKPYLETSDPIEAFHLFEQFRLLCAVRKGPYGVMTLNLVAEKILQEENLITPGKRWYRGRPVLITRNDYNLGLFNGDIGIILPDPASNQDLRALFLSPDGTLRKLLPIRLPEHETVFAMTVHKSQGSEFDKALLLLPDRHTPLLTRELIYTGITRAKKGVDVWCTEGVFLESVNQQIQRVSGLRDALWEG
ncbi:MAG: exodeoxyribonuclease V subunit alpha, partial [Desulfobacteraceae bacterium]|nr:exodeoxyribonuclease V subunit alpha [Desulfobacteraceae bacterium]